MGGWLAQNLYRRDTEVKTAACGKNETPSSVHYSTVKIYRVSLSLSLRAPQTYGTDSQHLLRFPVTAALPSRATRDTHCTLTDTAKIIILDEFEILKC